MLGCFGAVKVGSHIAGMVRGSQSRQLGAFDMLSHSLQRIYAMAPPLTKVDCRCNLICPNLTAPKQPRSIPQASREASREEVGSAPQPGAYRQLRFMYICRRLAPVQSQREVKSCRFAQLIVRGTLTFWTRCSTVPAMCMLEATRRYLQPFIFLLP